jgi:hypothetical protein
MSSPEPYRSLTVRLTAKDHRSFANARRRLRRLMGPCAPDLAALCSHQLRGRDAAGLAEDYLAAVGWPCYQTAKHLKRRERKTARLLADLSPASSRPPRDLDRN